MNENNWKCRTELLLGEEQINLLQNKHVLVVGVGGVGGYAAEQLCRAGIGKLTLVDNDTVHPSNKNRQLIALNSTIDTFKTRAFEKRLKDINPDIEITTNELFIKDDSVYKLLEQPYDYVIDAIDTLTPKVDLIEACVKKNLPLVSSMGSGGRMAPEEVQIAEIENSHHCKLAYIVRKRLHHRGVYKGFKVIFSPEQVPDNVYHMTDGSNNKKTIIGTLSYMPAIFGCYAASVVIRQLLLPDGK